MLMKATQGRTFNKMGCATPFPIMTEYLVVHEYSRSTDNGQQQCVSWNSHSLAFRKQLIFHWPLPKTYLYK